MCSRSNFLRLIWSNGHIMRFYVNHFTDNQIVQSHSHTFTCEPRNTEAPKYKLNQRQIWLCHKDWCMLTNQIKWKLASHLPIQKKISLQKNSKKGSILRKKKRKLETTWPWVHQYRFIRKNSINYRQMVIRWIQYIWVFCGIQVLETKSESRLFLHEKYQTNFEWPKREKRI